MSEHDIVGRTIVQVPVPRGDVARRRDPFRSVAGFATFDNTEKMIAAHLLKLWLGHRVSPISPADARHHQVMVERGRA